MQTWVVAMIAAASGAAGKALIQSSIRGLRLLLEDEVRRDQRKSEGGLKLNGHRHEVLATLGRIEQYTIDQGNAIAAVSNKLIAHDLRLRAIEAIVHEVQPPPPPRTIEADS